ncbi:MAG TPA: amidohydrolase [Clostridia bacterium]|jgi:imidazolonepropionase-like amidohydrolase|nr:amidohydrolase [Clostridia bacterium]HHY06280.1 amidohydrolase [Clostridia bacterium]
MNKTALINGHIYTMAGSVLEKGTLLWEKGKITAVGEKETLPPDAEVIDLQGKTVVPGFVDAHTHLGILEEIYQEEGDDLNEFTEPLTPEMRALDAVNPLDIAFRDAVCGGITTVMTGPGSANVLGGTNLVLKTAGNSLEKMVLLPQSGLKTAFGENPKRVFSEQKKIPCTRMGVAALLRQALIDAQNYMAKAEKVASSGDVFERDLGMENLVLVLEKKIPLNVHAHRADDILTAIRIVDEFRLEMILSHGTEAQKIIPELQKRNIPVVVGPTLSSRAKVEMAEITWQTAVRLNEAEILVALTTDHSVVPIQYLPLCAALAVRHGMPEEEALRAITINPARILKLEHRIGSLEVGKDADIVVMSGHPLDWRSYVERVYINGKIVYDKL